MNKRSLPALAVFSMLCGLTPVHGAQPAPGAPASPANKPAPPPLPAYARYQFYADRYRDPFIPLVGEIQSDQMADRAPQIGSLLLKGIVQDTKGRMALLNSGVSSYILRAGRLYNSRNRLVKGVSGVIKADSVLIIGADRTVRELRVRPKL